MLSTSNTLDTVGVDNFFVNILSTFCQRIVNVQASCSESPHPTEDSTIVDNFFVNILSTCCQHIVNMWQPAESLHTLPRTVPLLTIFCQQSVNMLSMSSTPDRVLTIFCQHLVNIWSTSAARAVVDNFLSTFCQHSVNRNGKHGPPGDSLVHSTQIREWSTTEQGRMSVSMLPKSAAPALVDNKLSTFGQLFVNKLSTAGSA